MKALILPVLLSVAVPALASTPEAWAESNVASAAACRKASGFLKPVVLPGRAGFGDDIGYDALLVRGVFPQRYLKGKSGTVLCLWDRGRRRAAVSEVQGWTAR